MEWLKSFWNRIRGLFVKPKAARHVPLSRIPGAEAQPFIIKFNPSGTHVINGQRKIRFDVYQMYDQHYVDVLGPDDKPTGEKKLNPVLCHFVAVPDDFDVNKASALVNEIFDHTTLTALDSVATSAKTKEEFMAAISELMRPKAKHDLTSMTKQAAVDDANLALTGFEVRL